MKLNYHCCPDYPEEYIWVQHLLTLGLSDSSGHKNASKVGDRSI